MVYSTGFGVNLGVVSALCGREDYILWDEQDHASIIEGRRLSFAQSLKYKHNDMESLEKQLQRCDPDKVKLIVTDGVFSMEGDVANVPAIVDLAKKYDATVMVDEAHSIGVFGPGGRGTLSLKSLLTTVVIAGAATSAFAFPELKLYPAPGTVTDVQYFASVNISTANEDEAVSVVDDATAKPYLESVETGDVVNCTEFFYFELAQEIGLS